MHRTEVTLAVELSVAAEILNNPKDLEIIIGKDRISRKYSIRITRGPSQGFKQLIGVQAFTDEAEIAICAAIGFLESLREVMETNPNGEDDESRLLNRRVIEQIWRELDRNRIACTYKW